jgi:hypothetical protein
MTEDLDSMLLDILEEQRERTGDCLLKNKDGYCIMDVKDCKYFDKKTTHYIWKKDKEERYLQRFFGCKYNGRISV